MHVRPTSGAAGMPGQRTNSGFTDHSPKPTRTISGSSFATVTVSTRRALKVMPRTLTAARIARSAAISSARPAGDPATGQTAATEPANALTTEATANDAIS